MAGWQSGHAAACKAVYAGSIPTPASISPSAGIQSSPRNTVNKLVYKDSQSLVVRNYPLEASKKMW